jgi:hypothetical protein
MSPDYGRRVAKAFEAVCQLFEDVSQLLSECDSTLGQGRPSVFGNVITDRLSTVVYEPLSWLMADAVRCYDAADKKPGLVEAITIYFWDKPALHDEPLLILGQIKYRMNAGESVKEVCKRWDLWHACFRWTENVRTNEVITLESQDKGRIEWLKFLAVPLFTSVSSAADVDELMDRVRQNSPSPGGAQVVQ